jgi:hypothetical protein
MNARALLHVLLALSCVGAAACATIAPARFADTTVVVEVDDERPIPSPAKRLTTPLTYANALGRRTIVEGLDPRRTPRALDVNAFDDVPRSSWFTEPAGGALGAVTNQESGPPEAPLRVMPRHPESGRSGLVVLDARGIRYEIGRDPKDRPVMRTAAAAIASNLVRAVGYRVPEVDVVAIRESELVVASVDGQPAPNDAVRAFLDDGPPPFAGYYRVTATRWPPGVDLGPTQPHAVRDDDANDRVPHEDRRTLRALRVVRAWLSFAGFGVHSLRDVYVGAPGKGHVEHFIVGLEGALGADQARGPADEPRSADAAPDPTRGRDPLGLLVTFGFGGRQPPRDLRFPSIGAFEPEVTSADYESEVVFAPTYRMTAADAYWVAKHIATVPNEAIAAAVERGRVDQPTRERLVRIIAARRDGVVARAYADVTPVDVVSFDGVTVTLRDYGFTRRAEARFEVETVDDAGAPLAPPRVLMPTGALFTLTAPRAPYVVVRLHVTRGDYEAPRTTEVHLRERAGVLRVVGVVH